MLKPPERRKEEPALELSPGSDIEREVLETLRAPAGYHPSLEDLRSRLLPYFTELQIQNALMSLLEEGMVDLVYTSDCELGFAIGSRSR